MVSLQSKNSRSGFTLIEVLITMVVAGILTAIAVPAFNNFVMNDRDSTQINSLTYSFNYARSEAVKLNTATGVTVCPSTDGKNCDATLPWSAGWIVFDPNPADCNNTQCPPLQVIPALAGSNVLTATGAGATGVTFLPSGAVVAPLAIKICDTRGWSYARDIEISQIGTIAASQNPGYSTSNTALTCP